MSRFLPIVFLLSVIAIFGLVWIVVDVDPEGAKWYIFGLFDLLLFIAVWGLSGLLLYFARTRLYRRYSANWYFYTSFKMAFFVAAFLAVSTILAILKLVTTLNIILAILAIILFAFWSYLGKKG
ncbi:MAG: hypothetical protein Q8P25_01890 [Candidatus Curtissbacteria bacterium]|nr:hypothetical protein [Candidatus Curtissbacteria bacterium]